MAENDVIKIIAGHQALSAGLTADELESIQAASALSGANPVASMADVAVPDLFSVLGVQNDAGGLPIVGLADPTDDQDAATKKWVADTPPMAAILAALAAMEEPLVLGGLDCTLTLTPEGSAQFGVGPALVTFNADGSMVFAGAAGNPTLTLAADGTWDINGAQRIQATATGLKLYLPTADPGVGMLWNDGGIVSVGTGA